VLSTVSVGHWPPSGRPVTGACRREKLIILRVSQKRAASPFSV
jgi:hypothetical protein